MGGYIYIPILIPIPSWKFRVLPIPIPIPSQSGDSPSKRGRVRVIPTGTGLFAISNSISLNSNLVLVFVKRVCYEVLRSACIKSINLTTSRANVCVFWKNYLSWTIVSAYFKEICKHFNARSSCKKWNDKHYLKTHNKHF